MQAHPQREVRPGQAGRVGRRRPERSHMKSRLIAAVLATVAGAALLATAALGADSSASASASAAARGGTLRVDNRNDFDFIDPSLAYFSHSWQLEWAVQLTLMSFPDREGDAGARIVPHASAGMPLVSRDGKTYTFTIKNGFRFSDGKPVTAANFAAAITRALNPKMQSPAASFLTDVVGAQAVLDGKAQRASGVTARGNRLQIRLTKVAPDFTARMSMPFFSAIPTNMPITAEGVEAPMVSAGPYYVRSWVKGRTATVVRNPHWNNTREPYKSLARPANVDQIVFTIGNSLDATRLRLEANQADLGPVPPAAHAELAQKYGLNQGRWFVRKQMVFWYLALNNEQPLFRGNTKLRQAINWAIDRPQLVRQFGYLAGSRTDQILVPGLPGYRDWDIYPLQGVNATSLARARSLSQGNTRSGKAVMYTANSSPGPQIAQVVQYNLKQIGIDVEIKQYDRVVQNTKSGTRGEPFDISYEGWGSDYPDPYNFVNKLLDGSKIQKENNNNLSYFNDPTWNKRMQQASTLSGDGRARAYADLDRGLMKDAAPFAPYISQNARILVGQDVGGYSFQPVLGSTNLVAVCKK
jgi:ABC-type transport system substrate-binding protein